MATRKSNSTKGAKPTVSALTDRLNLAVAMAQEIDALFHYLASQTQFATNADDGDHEDWNGGDENVQQSPPHESMRREASRRGFALTTALMDLAVANPNMDECRTLARRGNTLLQSTFVFGRTCPTPWLLMQVAMARAQRAAQRSRAIPIDTRCVPVFSEPNVCAIDRRRLTAARKDAAFRRFLENSGLSAVR